MGSRAYDEMNDLAAAALCDLTSSVRFEGALNVDLSDIAVNLVPFPSLHFLVPAVAPLPAPLLAQPRPPPSQLPPAPRALELLQRVTRDENQLIKVRLSQHAHLACAFLGRGDLSITEVNAALGRVGGALHVPFWNRDSFKVGARRGVASRRAPPSSRRRRRRRRRRRLGSAACRPRAQARRCFRW
jgi:tubulin epsilon